MEIEVHAHRARRLSILSTGLAVLIAFVLLMAYQYVSGRRQLMEELRTEATIIGANSSAALLFNDTKAAKEILGAIRHTPRIVGAALYHSDGWLFVLENDSQHAFPGKIERFDPNSTDLGVGNHGRAADLIRQEVYQDDTRVGTLLIHVTYVSLYWRLLEYSLGIFIIAAIALLLAHRFTVSLRKTMALTEDQLQKMALYDQVTGLPNRSFFEYELGKMVALIKREGRVGALLFIDVDNFKKVNDLCGHLAGDQVLLMIAERLKRTVRATDIVGRIGGDEFAVVLFECGSPENVAKVADQMIAAIAEPFPTQPSPSHVGLSIGVTMIPNDADDPETLLRWSDMAMYVAKSQGKNRYQFFSEEINDKVSGELQMETALRSALKDPGSGLWVAYQPQVCAQTRKIVGVEALMRWRLESGAFVSPGEFIPIAEKTGLIVDLGVWLVERICQDLAEMRSHGIEISKVAVNVSPRELTRGVGIVDGICRTLEAFAEDVGRFQFELTENALMDEAGSDVLDAFREAGFSLAIDDFGSGYSSLGYLKRFDVSTLKIDQQFVQRLPGDAEDAAIVLAVIQMCKALGITVVAEGVETEAQAQFLASHGCEILQGYLLCRPIPPRELEAYIRAD
jgi:diguanylate cyclase (GGDEF)-like protein